MLFCCSTVSVENDRHTAVVLFSLSPILVENGLREMFCCFFVALVKGAAVPSQTKKKTNATLRKCGLVSCSNPPLVCPCCIYRGYCRSQRLQGHNDCRPQGFQITNIADHNDCQVTRIADHKYCRSPGLQIQRAANRKDC